MSLRDELMPLTHDGRVQKVLERARAKDAQLPSLETADAFGRRVGGVATFIDRDGARVLRELEDPSRTVRSLAMVLAPLVCDDAQSQRALELAWSLKGERRLLLGFTRRKRRVVIDTFLQWLHTNGHHRELIDASRSAPRPVSGGSSRWRSSVLRSASGRASRPGIPRSSSRSSPRAGERRREKPTR